MRILIPVLVAGLSASTALAQAPSANQAKPTAAKSSDKAPEKKAEKKERKGTKWDLMDTGPFFSSGIAGKNQTLKGLSIKLGTNASVCFDTELLRMSFGWTGGFLRLPTGRDGLEGVPELIRSW